MTKIYSFLQDTGLWLKLVDRYENLEGSEFTLSNYEYEDLGGIYGTNIENRLCDTTPIVFDEKVIVTGYFEFLPYLDYIYVGSGGSIMNQKMLDALLSVGEFSYQKLPCRIMDIESLEGELEFRQFTDNKLASSYPYSDDYFFLHLTNRTHLPHGLQTDPSTLPPILIPDLKDKLFGVFITQLGKEALISAQIHGIDFILLYQHQKPLQN